MDLRKATMLFFDCDAEHADELIRMADLEEVQADSARKDAEEKARHGSLSAAHMARAVLVIEEIARGKLSE